MIRDDSASVLVAVRGALSTALGPQRFALWFAEKVRWEWRGVVLTLIAPSSFHQDCIRRNYRPQILAACEAVLGRRPRLEFAYETPCVAVSQASHARKSAAVPAGEAQSASSSHASASTGAEASSPPDDVLQATATPKRSPLYRAQTTQSDSPSALTPLRPFARLEEYSPGDVNRVAWSAAQTTALSPGMYRPLVFHGPSGSGKTHLLEGIVAACRQHHPRLRAVLITAEQFTSEFVDALHSRQLPGFRRKFRGVHLLAIDDVQFLLGKKASLEELAHTLHTLHAHGRQVVLSAPRPLVDSAQLGPELCARLAGGMQCRLELPDAIARRAIVSARARELGMELDDTRQEAIAETVVASGRELQGAVNRLHGIYRATDHLPSADEIRGCVADLVPTARRNVGVDDVVRAVCDTLGVDVAALHVAEGARQFREARMLAMWLARKYTRAGLGEIGHYFGARSHSTVHSAQRKFESLRGVQGELRVAQRTLPIDEVVAKVERRLQQA